MFIESTLGDPARLAEVARYDRSDPMMLAELDDVAARSAVWTEMPMSLISLIAGDTQIVVGRHGLPDTVTLGDRVLDRSALPTRWSFCVPMVRSGHSHVIPDMRAVPALAANPYVTTLGLRGYIGIPLLGDDGSVIGSHCLLGPEPIALRLTDILALETGAADALAILNRYRPTRRRPEL